MGASATITSPGIDERLANEVDHLLAARGDDHFVGIHRRALLGHHFHDALRDRAQTLRRPVLKGTGGGVRGHLRHQARVALGVEGRGLGQAPAREMTSGRSVRDIMSRIADERMPCVRAANSRS